MLWCGAGERCRCCGAALLSGVGIDCGVVYVSGVDAVMHVSSKWGEFNTLIYHTTIRENESTVYG